MHRYITKCRHCIYGEDEICMKTNIKKWGNSYAVRIPKHIIDDAHIDTDDEVELSIVEGNIILSPIHHKKYTLEALLSQINEKNIHKEIDTGSSVGKEA